MKGVLRWLVHRGMSCRYQRFFFCLGCSSRPSLSSPYTFSIPFPPSPSQLGRQPCWVACLVVWLWEGSFHLSPFTSVSTVSRNHPVNVLHITENLFLHCPKPIFNYFVKNRLYKARLWSSFSNFIYIIGFLPILKNFQRMCKGTLISIPLICTQNVHIEAMSIFLFHMTVTSQ